MTELANLSVPSRFNGPPDSGNGGVVCGLLAGRFGELRDGPVTVTLRQPPPLDVQMRIEQDDEHLRAFDGTLLVAEARRGAAPAGLDGPAGSDGPAGLRPVAPVDLPTAVQASGRYAGFVETPYPTCFGCGPSRPQLDGLGVFAGPIDPAVPTRVAAPYRPRIGLAITPRTQVWAALDCPGGWSVGLDGRRIVLGGR
jgi:hypothetical protein